MVKVARAAEAFYRGASRKVCQSCILRLCAVVLPPTSITASRPWATCSLYCVHIHGSLHRSIDDTLFCFGAWKKPRLAGEARERLYNLQYRLGFQMV